MAIVVRASAVRLFIGGVEIKRPTCSPEGAWHFNVPRPHSHEIDSDGRLSPPKYLDARAITGSFTITIDVEPLPEQEKTK